MGEGIGNAGNVKASCNRHQKQWRWMATRQHLKRSPCCVVACICVNGDGDGVEVDIRHDAYVPNATQAH